MTGRHAGRADSLLFNLLMIISVPIAVLGFLALLGWGIYLVADHQRAYEIFLAGAVIVWIGKLVAEWWGTRRFPWSWALVAASSVLILLSNLAPSWPWVPPAQWVVAGLLAASLIKPLVGYWRRRARARDCDTAPPAK